MFIYMKSDKFGIICLDLDETLFHTKNHCIYFRPKLINFLKYLNKYIYLVVYTAATKQYADSILSKIKWNDKKIIVRTLFKTKKRRNICNRDKRR